MKEMKKKTHSTNPVNVYFVHWICFGNIVFPFFSFASQMQTDFLNIVFHISGSDAVGSCVPQRCHTNRKVRPFSCIHPSEYAIYFVFILIFAHVPVGLTLIPASTVRTSLLVLAWKDSTISSCSFWAFLSKRCSRRWVNCGAKMFESW